MPKLLVVSLVALCLTALAGCTHPERPADVRSVSAPVPAAEGKPMAPVDITGEVGTAHAHFTLKFEKACEKAVATVHGLDGLEVQQVANAVGERSFRVGETATLDADVNGQGTLVVRVSGTFNGMRSDRVATFVVGNPDVLQHGQRVTPQNGEGMHAMPAGN